MAKRKKKAAPEKYSGELELRIPNDTMARLQKVALVAEMSVQDVIRVILAIHVESSRPTSTCSETENT